MNQFRLDLDATRCAEAHQDAHCGKMLLELTQQLCAAFPQPWEQYIPAGRERRGFDAVITAYRAYYRAEKRGYWRKSRDPAKPSTWVPAKWTKRDPPEWF
jgi:hypothetical protein